MNHSAKEQVSLTSPNIAKNMVLFAIPVLFSSWLQLSFNLADYIVCGNYVSDVAVGAIGATNSISALIVDLFIGLSIGVNVVIGNCFGAKDREKAERALGVSTLLGLVFGLLVALIGIFFSRNLLIAMGTPSDILDMSTTYLSIYLAGAPFLLLYNFGAAALRSMGDTMRPFLFLTIGGVLNACLNLLLVIPIQLGVMGLAIATVASEIVSGVLVYLWLIFKKGLFAGFRFRNLRLYRKEGWEVIQIGFPAGIQSIMFDFTNVLIQSTINSFGTATISGDSAANRIGSYVYCAMDSFAQAGVAFVSANNGAKNKEGIRKSIRYAILFGLIIDIIASGIVILLRRYFLLAIIKNEEAIAVGEKNIIIIMSTYTLMTLVDILPSGERGLGQSLLPALVAVAGIALTRIVYVYTLFQLEQFHTMEWLYAAYPISWFITAFAHGICLFFVVRKRFKEIDAFDAKQEISRVN